ncbi:class I SAM-dependent methyltransferase [Laceyella tengchongensis]
MMEKEPRVSLTALISAYGRAYHAMYDSPKIFDDFLARQWFTDEAFSELGAHLAQSLPHFAPEKVADCQDQASALRWVMQSHNAISLSRSKHAEDSLELAVRQGARQYVILGAGLDTFAFRRPDMLEQIHVFEVDHPATQAFKRRRLAELDWEQPPQLHFVPVDFTAEKLADALCRTAFDPQLRSFFSWLGVTYYLDRETVFDTLRSFADIAATGSWIVFDYLDLNAFDTKRASVRVKRMQEAVSRVGEPMKTGFDPATLAKELAHIGLRLEENLPPTDIEERYFQGRTDGYRAFEHIHFARAVVDC